LWTLIAPEKARKPRVQKTENEPWGYLSKQKKQTLEENREEGKMTRTRGKKKKRGGVFLRVDFQERIRRRRIKKEGGEQIARQKEREKTKNLQRRSNEFGA